jgi:hypothetical protein
VRARAVALIAAGACTLVVAGCDPDTVDVSFRPTTGSTYVYESSISSVVTTQLADEDPDETHDSAVLRTTQHVLGAGEDGVQVQVGLSRPGSAERTFVVRLDRAAQLVSVESVEGIPSEALGELGLSEIFPAAAGAPPSRPLRPGDRWRIDDDVELPGAEATKLHGEGRLIELGVVDGHDLATITSTSSLPLSSTVTANTGTRTLTGTQETEVTSVYDLADGSVREATSVAIGRFTLVIGPPEGQTGKPITGVLVVEVRSKTRRVG